MFVFSANHDSSRKSCRPDPTSNRSEVGPTGRGLLAGCERSAFGMGGLTIAAPAKQPIKFRRRITGESSNRGQFLAEAANLAPVTKIYWYTYSEEPEDIIDEQPSNVKLNPKRMSNA
ncbi:MAG: hypothetical protein L0387_14500 [Acidobacteria bacterium]|nr:hypothetical protein [Acidobacteriota bacterium]